MNNQFTFKTRIYEKFDAQRPHAFEGYNEALNAIVAKSVYDRCSCCGDKAANVQYRELHNTDLCSECNYNHNEGWVAQYEI